MKSIRNKVIQKEAHIKMWQVYLWYENHVNKLSKLDQYEHMEEFVKHMEEALQDIKQLRAKTKKPEIK